jgi:hypothetical protein
LLTDGAYTSCAKKKKGKFIILYDTVHHIFLSFSSNVRVCGLGINNP